MKVSSTAASNNSPLCAVLAGRAQTKPPVWLMRQAGRYLPEYQAVRKSAGSFLDLCFTPALAAEVTLQPVRRFGFDAAILFSDILVVPHAFGRRVHFVEGEGPRLEPLDDPKGVDRLANSFDEAALQPVFDAIALVKARLPPGVALLGFCGAPWTVATYMIAGRGTADQMPARLFAYQHREAFARLIDILIDASARYVESQFRTGVDAVQIFDTWAGVLPCDELRRWCIEPTQRIIDIVRRKIPDARFIAFPRGVGSNLPGYLEGVAANAIGLDWTVDLTFARDEIQKRRPVQGNLDPMVLRAGGKALDRSVDAILAALSGGPFIFNLGHGILPDTPIAHVERMLRRVRA